MDVKNDLRELLDNRIEFLRENLKKSGKIQLAISGDSMNPIIRSGDQVTIEPATISEIRKFDIIVFSGDNELICHYVWRIDRDINSVDRKIIVGRSYRYSKSYDTIFEENFLGRVSSHRLNFVNRLRCFVI